MENRLFLVMLLLWSPYGSAVIDADPIENESISPPVIVRITYDPNPSSSDILKVRAEWNRYRVVQDKKNHVYLEDLRGNSPLKNVVLGEKDWTPYLFVASGSTMITYNHLNHSSASGFFLHTLNGDDVKTEPLKVTYYPSGKGGSYSVERIFIKDKILIAVAAGRRLPGYETKAGNVVFYDLHKQIEIKSQYLPKRPDNAVLDEKSLILTLSDGTITKIDL